MSVTLEIPAEIVESVRVPPQELEERLRLELALALFRRTCSPQARRARWHG
jgi:uncharacterized membrane protein